MLPWFLLYPALAAALGGGVQAARGKDWKKGALVGAGLGLGAGYLAPAAAGGAGGWAALTGSGAGASNAAFNAAMASKGIGGAEGAAAMKAAALADASAKGMSWSQLAKQAAVSTGLGQGINAMIPKYSQTQLLMNPSPMQDDNAAVMAQLEQLMKKKGGLV